MADYLFELLDGIDVTRDASSEGPISELKPRCTHGRGSFSNRVNRAYSPRPGLCNFDASPKQTNSRPEISGSSTEL